MLSMAHYLSGMLIIKCPEKTVDPAKFITHAARGRMAPDSGLSGGGTPGKGVYWVRT